MNNNKKKIYYLVNAALFTAIITVTTAYIKFNTGINNGYVHVGDSAIYLAACILPAPYSFICAAIGGAFADLLAGAAVWAPFTAIIKALNSIVFWAVFKISKNKSRTKILSKSSVLAGFLSGLVTIGGYFLCEGLLYSFASAATSVPFSLIQSSASLVIFIILAAALDKANLKNRFTKD